MQKKNRPDIERYLYLSISFRAVWTRTEKIVFGSMNVGPYRNSPRAEASGCGKMLETSFPPKFESPHSSVPEIKNLR
jgi:hypothetical protein